MDRRDELISRLQSLRDEQYRRQYGEDGYRAMLKERRLRHVCYKCPYRCVDDEGKLEPCDPPSDFQCMRKHEEDFIKMEEDERG